MQQVTGIKYHHTSHVINDIRQIKGEEIEFDKVTEMLLGIAKSR